MNKPIIWVQSAFHERKTAAPGSANWKIYEGGGRHLQYVCPCGCGEWRNLPVKEGEKVKDCWYWDGNEIAPTITPSIQHVRHEPDDCNWHGYVTKGEWVTV